jgi:hypothetical protein
LWFQLVVFDRKATFMPLAADTNASETSAALLVFRNIAASFCVNLRTKGSRTESPDQRGSVIAAYSDGTFSLTAFTAATTAGAAARPFNVRACASSFA